MADRRRRLGAQRGASLVEVLVASALLGIGVVAGMEAWDTATISAQHAVRQAWARCVVRSERGAILASRWQEGGYAAPAGVTVDVSTVRGATGTPGEEQQVTVSAVDPQSRRVLASETVLKLQALEGFKSMDSTGVQDDVSRGCPSP